MHKPTQNLVPLFWGKYYRRCKYLPDETISLGIACQQFGLFDQMFSHDVTAAILVYQNNEMVPILVWKTNSVQRDPKRLQIQNAQTTDKHLAKTIRHLPHL